MNNKIIITDEEKNKIKMRLYFTYFFYEHGYNLDDNYTSEINNRYEEFLKSTKSNSDNKKIELRLIKFELENRLLLMIISLICEMYEQFLGSILILNLNINAGLTFNDIQTKYCKYGYELSSNSHWEKINELRKLVNVIKHSDGRSRRELQKIRPDYFDDAQPISNTLNDVELNVWPKDLEEYLVEIMKFIDEMPNTIENNIN